MACVLPTDKIHPIATGQNAPQGDQEYMSSIMTWFLRLALTLNDKFPDSS